MTYPPEYTQIADTGYRYAYEYLRPALTSDSILFAYDHAEWHILLIRRGHQPYKGCWALPGGFMEMNETLQACARRELMEEAGIVITDSRFVGIYDTVDRDPRGRVVTSAYVTVLPDMPTPQAGDDAAEAQWIPLSRLRLDACFTEEQMADILREQTDPAAIYLAFDQARMVSDALRMAHLP